MKTKYIQTVKTFGPHKKLDVEVIKSLKKNFSGLVSRRMTKLALMVGECLKDETIQANDTVNYATTFSESICLEKYLDSFPTPSPLMFQNSIHPSGMEQILIARKQPVEQFMSFAGNKYVMHSALVAAITLNDGDSWVVGAEEIGTWLTEQKCASDLDFAFAIKLSNTPESSIGSVSWNPQKPTSAQQKTVVSTLDFLKIIQSKQATTIKSESQGELEINWT